MYGTISFPGLGLSFNPSRVAFSIGNKPISDGIIIATGFLLAVYYAMRRADQFGLTQDNIIDMLICAVPLAIIGARAYSACFPGISTKMTPSGSSTYGRAAWRFTAA